MLWIHLKKVKYLTLYFLAVLFSVECPKSYSKKISTLPNVRACRKLLLEVGGWSRTLEIWPSRGFPGLAGRGSSGPGNLDRIEGGSKKILPFLGYVDFQEYTELNHVCLL